MHCVGAPGEFGRSDIAVEEEHLAEESVLTDENAQPVLVRVYRRMVVGLFSLLCCYSLSLPGVATVPEQADSWALPAHAAVRWIKSLNEIDNTGKIMSLYRLVPGVVRIQKYLTCTDERE